ncbi:beta strand repeat-containing protein [Gemmatimonas groenlandica]|uniref:Ig domain-containing protein n=1 Tax=Gemmatimonas groenlandica TaxID=2732249 RepID=A0A6M4IQK3_9BACT|nr:Ig-like domain-containing protein [Gemmatimonas groenlandica]QJR36039.1 Ig domain-containing protein [Gemmatimonas groenlandica]
MQLFSRNKAIVALSLGALALGACGDDVTVPVTPNPPVTLSITPPSASMNVGEAVNFAVQISGGPTTGGPTLASCTTSSATVATAAVSGSSCRVTAVAAGNATVTATASTGQSAAASVTVAPAITGLTVTPSAASLQVNQTLTLSPSVQPAGRTATYTYASSSATIASVSTAGVVTAVGTGVATITVTALSGGTSISQAVAITVTALPTGIATLNVTPAALALAIGNTAQIGANATQPSGAPAATITYTSSSATVASVSAAGVVTANAPGTAIITVTAASAANTNFAASSLSSSVAVTVAAPANVTIANVTQGPVASAGGPANTGITFSANTQVNQPVDINNTRDQIQVSLNLQPNGQAVSAVRVYVCDATGNNCGAPAAEQTYTGNAANEGTVQLSINTADFTADFATGTSTIKYTNGLHVIKASVRTAAGAENFSATNNNSILNFTNVDGWAVQFTNPTAAATRTVSGVAYNYYGGPNASGAGSIRYVPVFYTAGRTVQSASVNMSNFGATVPYSATAATTYGKSSTLYSINGTGWEHPQTNASDFPRVAAAQDNSNNAAPTVSATTGYRTSITVPAPIAIRLDYANPTVAIAGVASGAWFSGVIASPFSFSANTTTTDNGVGTSTGTLANVWTYSGCGVTGVALSPTTAAGIPECATNFTNLVYTVTATGNDQLGNTGTTTTAQFAIDNVAPAIRYSAAAAGSGASATPATPGQGPGSALDTTTYTVLANSVFTGTSFLAVPLATDTIFGAEALDERSGLNTAEHYLARANQAALTGSCVVGTAFTAANGGIGSAFITAPNCTPAAAAIGTAMIDGYRPIARVLGANIATEGYYTYRASVIDRAGNTSFTGIRRVLHSATNPTITGLGVPGTVTATGPNAFTPNFTELVEGHFTNFRASYSGLTDGTTDANLLFPATLYNARFNDAIGINGNVTIGTPFTTGINYYTNIEQTNAAGNIASATDNRPDTVTARVVNAGGLSTGYYVGVGSGVALLSANVGNDTQTWATANPNLISWTLGQGIVQWNAPATGVKAIVTATTNQINSPFDRVDFYELLAGNWQYIGSVDGKSSPSVSPVGAGPVYIADNGATRVWTYRLTQPVNGASSLNTPAALSSVSGRRFIAVGTGGTFAAPTVLKGRALSTNAGVTPSTVTP